MSHDEHMTAKLATIPKKYHAMYLKAMSGKSRRTAIMARCRECMGWTSEPCGCVACPLYPYRV